MTMDLGVGVFGDDMNRPTQALHGRPMDGKIQPETVIACLRLNTANLCVSPRKISGRMPAAISFRGTFISSVWIVTVST